MHDAEYDNVPHLDVPLSVDFAVSGLSLFPIIVLIRLSYYRGEANMDG